MLFILLLLLLPAFISQTPLFDGGIDGKRSNQPYGWLFSRRPDTYDYDVAKRRAPMNPYSFLNKQPKF